MIYDRTPEHFLTEYDPQPTGFLPNDYTRCMGEGCPRRDTCARYLHKPRDVPYASTADHLCSDGVDMRIAVEEIEICTHK